MWNLPGPQTEPLSPASAGRFLSTATPGTSSKVSFWSIFFSSDSITFFTTWLTRRGVHERGCQLQAFLSVHCCNFSIIWNCHFFGLKWPLVLWNQISPGTASFLITRLEVVAGTKEASAQSQGDLHGALGKLDQWGLSLLPIHLAEQDAGRQPWKKGIFLFFFPG